jgi:hypothetical protein
MSRMRLDFRQNLTPKTKEISVEYKFSNYSPHQPDATVKLINPKNQKTNRRKEE